MRTQYAYTAFALCLISVIVLAPLMSYAESFKILVVMSYDEEYPWVKEVEEGIDAVLAEGHDLHYFYMDTKRNMEGGPQKAKEAFELYQELQPDGVIAVDDNAQSMFVVPYLKDVVDTPVMFCGVNADAGQYGYPASNVTGILERHHIRESTIFIKQLIPEMKTVALLMKDNPSSAAVIEQIKQEAETYPLEFIDFKLPNTIEEALQMAEELKAQADVVFLETMIGLLDENGNPLTSDEGVVPLLAKTFGKPTFGSNSYHVKLDGGVLCSVIKTGQEQGDVSAHMLLQAMQGTPISGLPIVQNKQGKRILNVTVMRELGIKPKPHILQGVEFFQSE